MIVDAGRKCDSGSRGAVCAGRGREGDSVAEFRNIRLLTEPAGMSFRFTTNIRLLRSPWRGKASLGGLSAHRTLYLVDLFKDHSADAERRIHPHLDEGQDLVHVKNL